MLHCCSGGPKAVAAWAPRRAFAFCSLIEEHGITRNNVRSSYPRPGHGTAQLTRPSLWDRSPPPLGLGALGVSPHRCPSEVNSQRGRNLVGTAPTWGRQGAPMVQSPPPSHFGNNKYCVTSAGRGTHAWLVAVSRVCRPSHSARPAPPHRPGLGTRLLTPCAG